MAYSKFIYQLNVMIMIYMDSLPSIDDVEKKMV